MKIYKYIGVALMVLALGACKTDDLERDIDALKDRVTAMEAKVDRLNESMNMIRVALDGNKTIQSYTENEDGSYTLTLSDGNTITLTQGKIGTIDEYQEVSISSNGNWVIGGVETKHHAVAADGEPGVTPQFRLAMESEGKYYWEVSYDGELTWEEVKNQQGTRVYASASGSSSVAGPIASAAPNATGDKFEITLTGRDTKYEIPIVSGLACAITDPNPENMENGYWIVPTNTGATTSIDLKGEAVLISAPEGWTVTASIDNSNPTTLSVTPPNQDGVEGIITLQVNKGVYWAIDQIKVRSKKVITSWYQEFLAGAEIVVNDVTIKKGSADDKVLINEKEVDLKVSLISDDNAEIAEDGLYFIGAGLNVTYKNSQNKNKVLINDSPTGEKPVVTCTNTITLNGTSLICKNVALKLNENATYRFLTINTNNAPYVAFDGCNLEVPSTATQNAFCYASTAVAINSFTLHKSKIKIDKSTEYNIISVGKDNFVNFNSISVENTIFYGNNASTFKLFGVNNGNTTNAGIGSLVLRNTTFLNMHYAGYGIVNGDISTMIVKNNIIYADNNNNNNVTVFRKRGNSSASLQATDGEVADNIGYIIGDFYLNLWQGDTPPLENAEKIQKLDASPFESLDKSTGTYVLKPEYQGYGAAIE
ncbi:PL29 family lyase N-terminal domain-containing protein [Phocaeicola plebeius]|uniref:PL29 family lyase N-terminal domain-containing protein n=1 Tax=Phocaeicola plebeius TaxID=310297 RepID=UPI0026F1FF29|nr:PL29 family lyase N-terminal domain-containing protein [Phocaeicola plebeius]